MSGSEDFSEDITNGGFGSEELRGDGGEEMMTTSGDNNGGAVAGDTEGMDPAGDDSMGGASGQGNGEEMDSSADTGSADQYGKDDDRKLFIGGLSWETTEKDLREYFAKYGGIESLTLKMDPATGRSRGFAFIVFSDVVTLDKVIAAGEHVINGKKVDPKKAKARHGKIFVGGLTTDISDDDIKSYFTQFGNVIEMEMPIDKTKNQRKGFCFITFDNEQIVHELLKKPKQVINGKEVDVKKAQPPQGARGGMMPWAGGAVGGRGSSRGGGIRGRGSSRGRGDYYGGYASTYGGYGQGYGSYGAYGDYYGGGYADYSGYGGYSGYGYDYGYDYEAGPPIPRGTGRGTSTRGGGGGGLNFCFKQGDSNNEVHHEGSRGICPTDNTRRSSSTNLYRSSNTTSPSSSAPSLMSSGHVRVPSTRPYNNSTHVSNWRAD